MPMYRHLTVKPFTPLDAYIYTIHACVNNFNVCKNAHVQASYSQAVHSSGYRH